MTSPLLELTGAIVPRLKSYAPLTGIVGARIYDIAPADAAFPYVTLGAAHEIQDDAECIDAVSIMFRIDAWSRSPGFPEVMRIAHAVRGALHRHEFTLSDNAFVEMQHRRTDRLRDPDGLTSHAVIEFGAIIEIP